MQRTHRKQNGMKLLPVSNDGFTLFELMVAMVVGVIVIAVIFATYSVQQRAFREESLKLATIQNARAALAYLEQELRMAGYDRLNSDLFGLINIGLDVDQNATVTFSMDMGAGGNTDNGTVDADETITYALYNSPTTIGTNSFDLGRTVNGSTELVAEGIEAIGLAFAFDSDNDGRLDWNDVNGDDVKQPNEGEFWAVDAALGDNLLDTNLDTDFDGDIDGNDALNGVALPVLPSGDTTVPMDRIRAVKIMLLARSKAPGRNYQDPKSYRVGIRPIVGNNFHRRFLTSAVMCRNLGH